MHWIHAIFFEILAVIATFFLRPLGLLFPQKKAVGGKEKAPLLLIHGYLHDSSAWFFFKRALMKKYLGPIYTLNLLRPFHSIEAHAEYVGKKIEEIQKETKAKKVILVGHSMGGLVAVTYAMRFKSFMDLHLITLGSPLKGTYLAYIALGKNGKEMRPGSDFLKELEKFLENSSLSIDHIGSMTDQIIVPQNSAFTNHPLARSYRIDDLGHMSLLFSSRVVDQIASWIK